MKASILLLYLRIFSNSRNLRFAVYAALATVVASHIGTLIVTTFDLRPLKCHWIYILTDEEWDAMCAEYWDDDIAYIFMSVFTIVLDILILAIPCPAVWKLNMPKRQKIGVMIIFSAGLVYETSLMQMGPWNWLLKQGNFRQFAASYFYCTMDLLQSKRGIFFDMGI